MKRIENDCCDCAVPGYPCRGDLCPLRHAVHIYCDECGMEITDEKAYYYEDLDYCADCMLDTLVKEGVIESGND